jgi:hypothetical protein
MRLLVVGVTVWLLGCHDTVKGRGSEACNEWQDALCTYAADRCGAMSRGDCEAQYLGVTCKSDAVANECAQEFDNARCGRADARCDLNGVADTEPAMRACTRLFDRFCERAVECAAFESQLACLSSEAVQEIDCGRAVAYRLAYETCYEQIDQLDCDELAVELKLPPSCNDVIIVRG